MAADRPRARSCVWHYQYGVKWEATRTWKRFTATYFRAPRWGSGGAALG